MDYGKPVRASPRKTVRPRTLMAIFGWLTLKEAERYTQAARRKRMARAGMGFLVREETNDEQIFPTGDPVTFPPIDSIEEFGSLAPRRGFGQLSNFNELAESGDAKSLRSIPGLSAGDVPTFFKCPRSR
jgi:hypothetical protein